MIDLYNPNIPTAITEYFTLLPFIMFSAAILNIVSRTVGLEPPPFYISDIVPFMYEGLTTAFNGVRK